MKIALIGPVYPYRGGIAHFTSMLYSSLIGHQHSVLLISFSRQYLSWLYPGKTDRSPSQDFFNLEAEFLLDSMDPRSWNRTFQRVLSFQPDIVILPWWTTFWAPAFTFISRKFRQKSIPILFLIHNVLPHEQKSWDRLLAKAALRQGDIFIVQAEHEADRLQDLIPGANPAICSHPVYNMFSAAAFSKPDAKNQLGISPDQKVLLFFGIVRPYKGLETLIHALVLLHPRGIKPTLIVAGEFWQDKSTLLNLIEKVNIKGQVLIEDRYISDQEIPTYFSAADIFVAPYRKGSQSGAVKLALGFNLPVVLSQTIVDPAILNLENYPVYIIPPDDQIELANSLEIALRDLKEKTVLSPESMDSGWDELVRVIEDSILNLTLPTNKTSDFQSQQPSPLVYVVTVNWNRSNDTLDCLASLTQSTYDNLRILVVDNGSTDGSPEIISREFPMVEQIHNSENLGFARGYNLGMKHALDAGADYIFIINNDATVAPETISNLIQFSDPQTGILAPLIYFADQPNLIWSSGGITNSWNLEKHDPYYEKTDTGNWESLLTRDFVTGCAVMFPKNTLSQVGYFDEKFQMYYEDMDLCIRIRREGLNILVVPEAKAWHKVATSSGGIDTPNERYWMGRSSVRFFRKHAQPLQKPVIIFWRTLSVLRTSLRLLVNNRITALKAYWAGLRDGLTEKI